MGETVRMKPSETEKSPLFPRAKPSETVRNHDQHQERNHRNPCLRARDFGFAGYPLLKTGAPLRMVPPGKGTHSRPGRRGTGMTDRATAAAASLLEHQGATGGCCSTACLRWPDLSGDELPSAITAACLRREPRQLARALSPADHHDGTTR
jgi:hypothetical protein